MKRRSGDKTQVPENTAVDAIGRVSSFSTYSSGSKTINGLLGGGYREGRLTELFGRSGGGKSQLAMQAVLIAAKGGTRSLYIDTEGSFRPERLEQMAKARGWETDVLLERIVYVRSDSSAEQMETIRGMALRASTSSCRLVVVDTLTRNFSVELPGRSNMSSRQAALNVHLSEMARDAYLHGRAYLLTNRVTFGSMNDIGIGGRTVEQMVHVSLRLDKSGESLRVTLLPNRESGVIRITESGVD